MRLQAPRFCGSSAALPQDTDAQEQQQRLSLSMIASEARQEPPTAAPARAPKRAEHLRRGPSGPMCGRRGAPRGARRTHGPRRGRGEGGDSRRPRLRGRASGGGDGGSADRSADARSQASGPPHEARAAKQGRRHERQATEARRAAPQAGTSCKPRRDAAGHGPTAGAPATRDEGQRRTALKAPAGPANAAQGPHGPQGARRSGPAVPPAARETPKQSTPPRAAGGAMPLHTSFVGRRAGQQTDGRGGGPSPSGARRRRLAAANSPQHGRRQSAPHATDRTREGTISKRRVSGSAPAARAASRRDPSDRRERGPRRQRNKERMAAP